MDASGLALRLLGDAIYANPLMLGYAWQKGWLPLSAQALRRAIELNGQQVERNLAAFGWGRRAAHDLAGLLRELDRMSRLPGCPTGSSRSAVRARTSRCWN
ncbi:hypothetical protein AD428_23605 [Achromobacter sp. DMS1]|nr:hypothetical protein AD428_23605 [Achromobacter sp. DMS1]